MRVLLVSSPQSVLAFDRITRLPNLGLCSIAANLDRSMCQVKIVDLILAGRKPERYFQSLLKDYRPNVVGFSCMSFQYSHALKLARLTKALDKAIKVVIGGYHPTTEYEAILESDDMDVVDFVIRNEGEVAFKKLIEALSNGNDFSNLPNLSYRKDDSIIHNPVGPLIELNELPLPDRDVRILRKGFHMLGSRADVIETSRGCVFDCNFCSMRSMYGKRFRTYPVTRVLKDIRDAYMHGARSIVIMDDNITVDGKRYKALCEAIIDAKLNHIKYIVQVSVHGLLSTPGLVEKMAESGVKVAFLGIENVMNDNLQFVRKTNQFKIDDVEEVVRELRKRNVVVIGSFIVGNPDDTEESIYANYEYAKRIKIDWPLFLVATPFPKTELRKELSEQGLITNSDDYSKYDLFHVNVRTRKLTSGQLHKIREDIGFKTFSDLSRFWRFMKHFPVFLFRLFFNQLIKEPGEVVGYVRGAFK